MWQTIHQKVRKAFSDAAMNYEILSSLHKEIGRELVRKVMDKECGAILDVGTGTGYLANKAKFYFPEALVIGLDIADGMVLEANKLKEGIQIVQADACALPFGDKSFELVISNLAYQWVGDLKLAFGESHRCLTDDGTLCATLFGYRTLEELFETMHGVSPSRTTLKRLPDQEILRSFLVSAGFKNLQLDFEIIKVEFADVMDLLKWTKGIGANILNQDVTLGRRGIERIQDYYKKHYSYGNGICATFEVIWVIADKRQEISGKW